MEFELPQICELFLRWLSILIFFDNNLISMTVCFFFLNKFYIMPVQNYESILWKECIYMIDYIPYVMLV
jgi:hypothetical protein